MAVSQDRKRQLADQLSQDSPSPVKSTSQHHDSWQYPPEFWDRLSKVWLTPDALEEIDRRTAKTPSFPPPRLSGQDNSHTTTTRELRRFAGHGGPDLTHLRGYPYPERIMSSHRSLRSRAVAFTDPTSDTSKTPQNKKSPRSPYNPFFGQHLIDHAILPMFVSQRPDSQKAWFGNLEPLTDGTIAQAKPDLYYGAAPEQLQGPIRHDLRGQIVPSTNEGRPVIPNLFLEVKGPDGKTAVAQLQACYYGAIGARAIHSLQNYREEEPVYDNKAYTFSSTYHDGQLKIYAHHITAPSAPGERPVYHMTRVGIYATMRDRESFVEGATAFRNLRDLSKRYRDGFIRAANARLSHETMSPPKDDPLTGMTELPLQDSSPDGCAAREQVHAASPISGDYYAKSPEINDGVLDTNDGTTARFEVDNSRKRRLSVAQEDRAAKKRAR